MKTVDTRLCTLRFGRLSSRVIALFQSGLIDLRATVSTLWTLHCTLLGAPKTEAETESAFDLFVSLMIGSLGKPALAGVDLATLLLELDGVVFEGVSGTAPPTHDAPTPPPVVQAANPSNVGRGKKSSAPEPQNNDEKGVDNPVVSDNEAIESFEGGFDRRGAPLTLPVLPADASVADEVVADALPVDTEEDTTVDEGETLDEVEAPEETTPPDEVEVQDEVDDDGAAASVSGEPAEQEGPDDEMVYASYRQRVGAALGDAPGNGTATPVNRRRRQIRTMTLPPQPDSAEAEDLADGADPSVDDEGVPSALSHGQVRRPVGRPDPVADREPPPSIDETRNVLPPSFPDDGVGGPTPANSEGGELFAEADEEEPDTGNERPTFGEDREARNAYLEALVRDEVFAAYDGWNPDEPEPVLTVNELYDRVEKRLPQEVVGVRSKSGRTNYVRDACGRLADAGVLAKHASSNPEVKRSVCWRPADFAGVEKPVAAPVAESVTDGQTVEPVAVSVPQVESPQAEGDDNLFGD